MRTGDAIKDLCRVLIVAAQADADHARVLCDHFAVAVRSGQLVVAATTDLSPGVIRADEIARLIAASRAIVLLLSSELLASKEDHAALEAAAASSARVVPVLLRDCDWGGTAVGKLEPLPRDRRPIAGAPDADRAWLEIVTAVRAHAGVPVSVPRGESAAPASAPRPRNPFCTAGMLPADHPAYVRRRCDEDLEDALMSGASLISVEGEYQIGKSSLALRAYARLREAERACRVDLAGLDVYDVALFHKGFFNQLARQLDAPVERWLDVEREAESGPLTLVLDELGHLSGSGVVGEKFIASLYHAVTSRPGGVRVIACVPSPVRDVMKACGLKNPKYQDGWRSIQVGAMEEGGLDHLFSMLPPQARAAVERRRPTVARLSRLHPCAVQRLCSRLFDAVQKGAPEEGLVALIEGPKGYQ